MKRSICLKTERLYIVPMTEEEIEIQIKEEKDEDNKKIYMEMLENCQNEPEDFLWFTPWKIILQENQKAVGDISFKGPQKNGNVEIRYAILPSMQKQGYMSEALGAVVNWAFRQRDVYFVVGETAPGNRPAQKVLENNGFVMYANGQEGPRYKTEKKKFYQSPFLVFILAILSVIMYLVFKMELPFIITLAVSIGFSIIGVVSDVAKAKRRERVVG